MIVQASARQKTLLKCPPCLESSQPRVLKVAHECSMLKNANGEPPWALSRPAGEGSADLCNFAGIFSVVTIFFGYGRTPRDVTCTETFSKTGRVSILTHAVACVMGTWCG